MVVGLRPAGVVAPRPRMTIAGVISLLQAHPATILANPNTKKSIAYNKKVLGIRSVSVYANNNGHQKDRSPERTMP